jgi:hypothetical protein
MESISFKIFEHLISSARPDSWIASARCSCSPLLSIAAPSTDSSCCASRSTRFPPSAAWCKAPSQSPCRSSPGLSSHTSARARAAPMRCSAASSLSCAALTLTSSAPAPRPSASYSCPIVPDAPLPSPPMPPASPPPFAACSPPSTPTSCTSPWSLPQELSPAHPPAPACSASSPLSCARGPTRRRHRAAHGAGRSPCRPL